MAVENSFKLSYLKKVKLWQDLRLADQIVICDGDLTVKHDSNIFSTFMVLPLDKAPSTKRQVHKVQTICSRH